MTIEPEDLAEVSCIHLRSARALVIGAVDSCFQWQAEVQAGRSKGLAGGAAVIDQAREAVRLLNHTIHIFEEHIS